MNFKIRLCFIELSKKNHFLKNKSVHYTQAEFRVLSVKIKHCGSVRVAIRNKAYHRIINKELIIIYHTLNVALTFQISFWQVDLKLNYTLIKLIL